MYVVRLRWQNRFTEFEFFDDYQSVIEFLAQNKEAGFVVSLDGHQLNEVDISRDVEMFLSASK